MFNVVLVYYVCARKPEISRMSVVSNLEDKPLFCKENYLAIPVSENYSEYKPISIKASANDSDKTINFSWDVEKQVNLKRLDEIEALEKGWDEYDAEPIPRDILRRVKETILTLDNQPRIFPVSTGEIQLEFNGRDNSYLEILVKVNGEIEVYNIDYCGNEHEFIKKYESIKTVIEDFYGCQV